MDESEVCFSTTVVWRASNYVDDGINRERNIALCDAGY